MATWGSSGGWGIQGPVGHDTGSAIRRTMQGNRSRDTKPELRLRSVLHARGLRYRVAARPIRGVRRTADVVFFSARVAVFVDGCFWHGCPHHYRRPSSNVGYWDAKVRRNEARDCEVEALLAEAGWTVVRVWEHEDPQAAADRIEEAIGRGAPARTAKKP